MTLGLKHYALYTVEEPRPSFIPVVSAHDLWEDYLPQYSLGFSNKDQEGNPAGGAMGTMCSYAGARCCCCCYRLDVAATAAAVAAAADLLAAAADTLLACRRERDPQLRQRLPTQPGDPLTAGLQPFRGRGWH